MSENNCNCFNDTLKRYQEMITKKIGKTVSDIQVEWEGYSYFFGGDYSPVNPKIKITYQETKVNGEPKKNRTKKEATILGSYCPFCGRKLAKDGEAA